MSHGDHVFIEEFDSELMTLLRDKNKERIFQIFKVCQASESFSTIPRLKDNFEATLLHYAAEYGNEDIVEYLIRLGSAINAQDKLGRTPLLLAVMGHHERVASILLNSNANVLLYDSDYRSPLDMLLGTTSRFSMMQNLLKSVTKQKIVDISLVQPLREHAYTLSKIASIGNVELIVHCLDSGFSVDDRDTENGKTALHVAVELNNVEAVKVLVERDANVDAFDNSMSTPLWYLYSAGTYKSNLKILKVLLSDMVLLTLSNNEQMMQIFSVLAYGCKDAVGLVLRRVENYVYAVDENGSSVVHYVAVNSNVDVIETLKDHNFDLNSPNNDGTTPLGLAAVSNVPHAVKFLLKNGANVRARDRSDYTPLLGVSQSLEDDSNLSDAKECVELLLEYDPNPFDNDFSIIFDFVSQFYTEATQAEGVMEEPQDVLALMEPIIALLATGKTSEKSVIQLACSKIQLQPYWVKYFETCGKQVDWMNTTTIHGNVTLIKFLMESEKKILGYVRNEDIVTELQRLVGEFEANSPYPDMLRKRLAKASELATLKKKAVTAICRIFGSKNNAHYFAAEYITDYLSKEDMQSLDYVWSE